MGNKETSTPSYDNKSWNDPRDFAKLIKAIALPQDVLSTSDRRLIELENQVQRLMEAHLALTQPTQVNKITTPCEICSGPHDTQCCMENPEQAFVEYASSHTDEAGEDDDEVMFIEIIRDEEPQNEDPHEVEGATTKEPVVEYFDTIPTRNELTYHRHVHIEKAYIDLNSPLNIMTRMMYNWIMRRKLNPMKDANGRIRNFTVVLRRPFIEISNMTYYPPEGVVRFIRGTDEVAYKMPHKIEQYDSLLDLEKEHTKSVYLRNEEDKRRGVEYVMIKILGFYKECLELGPEYLTGVDDEGEVTKFFIKNKNSVFTDDGDGGDGVAINTRHRHHDTCDGVTPTLTASNAQVIFDEKKLGSS
ncbi:hypothetical protein Tco_1237022 [Tanacetum coccineum]